MLIDWFTTRSTSNVSPSNVEQSTYSRTWYPPNLDFNPTLVPTTSTPPSRVTTTLSARASASSIECVVMILFHAHHQAPQISSNVWIDYFWWLVDNNEGIARNKCWGDGWTVVHTAWAIEERCTSESNWEMCVSSCVGRHLIGSSGNDLKVLDWRQFIP